MRKKRSQVIHHNHKKKFFVTYKHMIVILLLILGAAYVLQANQQTPQKGYYAAVTNCTVAAADLAIKPAEKKMFDDLNAYRRKNGLSPYAWSPVLKQSSQWLSSDMKKNSNMDHTDSLGRDIDKRLEDCGYTGGAWGENIYSGSSDPDEALTWWKNDPPHNEALLSKEYTQIGISRVGKYWTQDFGSGSDTSAPAADPTAQPESNPTEAPVPSPNCLGTTCETTPEPTAPPIAVPTVDPGIVAPPTDPGVDSGMPPSNDSGSGGDISNGNGNGSSCSAKRRKLRKKKRKLKRLKRKKSTKKVRKKIRKVKKKIKKLKRKINNRC